MYEALWSWFSVAPDNGIAFWNCLSASFFQKGREGGLMCPAIMGRRVLSMTEHEGFTAYPSPVSWFSFNFFFFFSLLTFRAGF